MKDWLIGVIMGCIFFVIAGGCIQLTTPSFWWIPGIITIPLGFLGIVCYVLGIASFAKAISDALHNR